MDKSLIQETVSFWQPYYYEDQSTIEVRQNNKHWFPTDKKSITFAKVNK